MKESRNFKLIYKPEQENFSDYILTSAENTLERLSNIFNYNPAEKTVITVYDIYDYGFGAAITTPQNSIRLEIEPFEPAYENIPYTERISWLLNHELVHIIVNDKANPAERFFRSVFGKVYPEKEQPLTILYSLITNHRRFTPRWHQEAIAVFLETWLSGGYGRTLGNFDEMYFRSLAFEPINEIPTLHKVDSYLSQTNFLLDQLNYIYGARFALYLVEEFGYDKLISWYDDDSGFYQSYESKFKEIYGTNFDEAWQSFIQSEIEFQNRNIDKVNTTDITPLQYVGDDVFGSVSQPFYSSSDSTVIFAYHRPDELATLTKLNLFTGKNQFVTSIPTPSIYQVSSTAYDSLNNYFFFTLNNNQLYRDLKVIDLNSFQEKTISKNSRVGHLSVSPVTKDLWGVQHNSGISSLIFSRHPYMDMTPVFTLNETNEFTGVSVSSDGKKLAAVIHKQNGEQILTLIDVEDLLKSKNPQFITIMDYGSPENPSWSQDDSKIYFNAYVNGISNIYEYDLKSDKTKPLSNTIVGLFKPIELENGKIFCFEFSINGFKPVIFKQHEISSIKAINYRGQNVVNKNPIVKNLTVDRSTFKNSPEYKSRKYSALNGLHLHTFIPTISGFQNKKVLGIYTRIGDPTLTHDFYLHAGISPFGEDNIDTEFHLKLKYDYKKELEFVVEHNSPYFYDLFNDRKKGLKGNIFGLSHNHFWVYDNPYKLKQKTSFSYYNNLSFFLDNLIEVSQPDFVVASTELDAQYLRRSVGSVEYESGYKYLLKGVYFTANFDKPVSAWQLHGDISLYNSFLSQHNIFLFNFAAGYHFENENLYQARFFLGGFGNRIIEEKDYKQYRDVFRFPGVPIYSIDTDQFLRLTFENNLPPVWLGKPNIYNQYPVYIDMSVYTQSLFYNSSLSDFAINAGAQINFHLKNWYNLESTLSFGAANAWYNNSDKLEWFVSFKLLKY